MSRLVAILNITPDSFSDGGQYSNPAQAAARIARLVQEGADVIDLGAESTRPGASRLDPQEEWIRLEPALKAAVETGIPISVDTRHPATARRALESGAQWINDVGGFADDAMVEAVKPHRCKLVVMHSLGIPPSADRVVRGDVVEEITKWACATTDRLVARGIERDRIILDPGIGFGKTAAQSLTLLKQVDALRALGQELLIGHSRKSFLAQFTKKPAADRNAETLIVSEYLALKGVDYLRVHDVASHRHMLAILRALTDSA